MTIFTDADVNSDGYVDYHEVGVLYMKSTVFAVCLTLHGDGQRHGGAERRQLSRRST